MTKPKLVFFPKSITLQKEGRCKWNQPKHLKLPKQKKLPGTPVYQVQHAGWVSNNQQIAHIGWQTVDSKPSPSCPVRNKNPPFWLVDSTWRKDPTGDGTFRWPRKPPKTASSPEDALTCSAPPHWPVTFWCRGLSKRTRSLVSSQEFHAIKHPHPHLHACTHIPTTKGILKFKGSYGIRPNSKSRKLKVFCTTGALCCTTICKDKCWTEQVNPEH